MNGCPIAPPLYVKKVGNPGHNRRRAPEEVADGRGGTRMTRHGVVIHCGHCKLPGHNRTSCSDLKAGIPPYVPAPKQHVRRRRRAEPTTEEDQEAEPNVQEQQEEAPNVQDQQEAQMQVEKETQIQVEKDAPPTDGNLETRRSVRLVKKKTKGVNSLYPLLRNLLASIFFLVFYDS